MRCTFIRQNYIFFLIDLHPFCFTPKIFLSCSIPLSKEKIAIENKSGCLFSEDEAATLKFIIVVFLIAALFYDRHELLVGAVFCKFQVVGGFYSKAAITANGCPQVTGNIVEVVCA